MTSKANGNHQKGTLIFLPVNLQPSSSSSVIGKEQGLFQKPISQHVLYISIPSCIVRYLIPFIIPFLSCIYNIFFSTGLISRAVNFALISSIQDNTTENKQKQIIIPSLSNCCPLYTLYLVKLHKERLFMLSSFSLPIYSSAH